VGNVWGGKYPGEMSRECPGWGEMSCGKCPGNVQGGKYLGEMSCGKCLGWKIPLRNVQEMSRVGNVQKKCVVWAMSGWKISWRNVQEMSRVGNVQEKCLVWAMSGYKISWRNVQGMSRVGNVLWEMSTVENVQGNVCGEKCPDTHANYEVSTCSSYD